jgi:hypothetical protein
MGPTDPLHGVFSRYSKGEMDTMESTLETLEGYNNGNTSYNLSPQTADLNMSKEDVDKWRNRDYPLRFSYDCYEMANPNCAKLGI